MLKKSKSKLKNSKKVHFDENQIIDKRTLSNSFEKNKKNLIKRMNTTTKLETNTRISTASTTKKTSMDDFTIIKLLGSGSYAQVILVKHNVNGKLYALKKINKNMLNNYEKQHEVHIEKQCLA